MPAEVRALIAIILGLGIPFVGTPLIAYVLYRRFGSRTRLLLLIAVALAAIGYLCLIAVSPGADRLRLSLPILVAALPLTWEIGRLQGAQGKFIQRLATTSQCIACGIQLLIAMALSASLVGFLFLPSAAALAAAAFGSAKQEDAAVPPPSSSSPSCSPR